MCCSACFSYAHGIFPSFCRFVFINNYNEVKQNILRRKVVVCEVVSGYIESHVTEVTTWSNIMLEVMCSDMCRSVAFREYKDANIPWGPQDAEALSHVEELRKVEPRLAVATQLLYRLRYELIAFGGSLFPSRHDPLAYMGALLDMVLTRSTCPKRRNSMFIVMQLRSSLQNWLASPLCLILSIANEFKTDAGFIVPVMLVWVLFHGWRNEPKASSRIQMKNLVITFLPHTHSHTKL